MLLCLKLRSAGQVKSEIDQIAAKLVQETVHAPTGGEMGVHIDRNKFRCVDRLIYRGEPPNKLRDNFHFHLASVKNTRSI